ncbi:hypothetical protein ACFFRR_003196 [Megaselia abdita]
METTSKAKLILFLGVLLFSSYSTVALQCVSCDSSKDITCVGNGLSLSLPNVTCSTECMVSINSFGDTIRGCSIGENPCEGNALCETCSSDICNGGIFPDDRLKCLQCDDCYNSTSFPLPTYCQNYLDNDQCFTYFDPTSLSTSRGCVSSPPFALCGNCLYEKCSYDGCNTLQPEISNFTCYDCIGSDGDCIDGQNLESTRCAHGNSCLVRYDNTSRTVYRGCVAFEKEECSDDDLANGFCKTCSTENCNGGIFPEDRLLCLQCQGKNGTDCYNGTSKSNACSRIQKFDRCYSYIDHQDIMHRGCESDDYCEGSESCIYCSLDGCNNISGNGESPSEPNVGTFSCFSCAGNDVACLLGSVPTQPCEHGNKCLMKVNADKSIERRCVSSLFETCENKTTCETCDGNMCNGGVFPKDGAELFYMIKIRV